jgi:Flp pilus assembly protein CpaB
VVARTASQGLTFVIPDGMRAVTVALDAISGVGGFVYPGDHVDVLTTMQQGEVTLTKTIVQNVEVLAMNELTSRPTASRGTQATDEQAAGSADDEGGAPAAEQVKSATLAVTPDQAQAVILSAFKGAVHLVLRPREDQTVVALAGQSDWDLVGLTPPAESAPEETEVATGPMGETIGWPMGMGMPPGMTADLSPSPGAPAAPAPAPAPTVEVIRGTDREVVTPQ